MTLHRFGDVTVAGVPFFVMDPARSPSGANLIALKGGPGSGDHRRRVPAARRDSDDRDRREPALPRRRRRLGLADRRRRRPRHAGDEGDGHVRRRDDAGTRAQERRDVRRHVRPRRGAAQQRRRRLHAPRTAALLRAQSRQARGAGEDRRSRATTTTSCRSRWRSRRAADPAAGFDRAQGRRGRAGASGSAQAPAAGSSAGPKEGGTGDAPLPETKPIVWAPGKTKVLIIGGGSAHNFGQFFGGTDGATLSAAGFSVNYTEDRDQAAAEIGKADVAVISVNRQFFDTPEYRKALFDFAAAGKGLVMLHPGTWYGFAAVAGAERHDRRRRRPRPRPHRGVLGQRGEARAPGDEGRAGVVHGRGRALLPERGSRRRFRRAPPRSKSSPKPRRASSS